MADSSEVPFWKKPLFSKTPTVALDVGEYSLKCAVLESTGNRVRSLWQGVLLPERAYREQELAGNDLRNVLTDLLHSCESTVEGFRRSVVTNLASQDLISRYLELPDLNPKEMDLAVRSRAREFLPFSLEEAIITWIPVPQLSPGPKKNAVFFVALPRERVRSLQVLLESCDLDITRLEVPLLALVKEFARNHATVTEGFVALVHAGFGATLVVAMRQNAPYFARDFGLAGGEFTYAMMMGEQCSWNQAEEMKIALDVRNREVSLEPFVQRWLNEIRQSLQAFNRNVIGATPIERIYLSGGTARWTGLPQRLEEYIEIPVEIDPWDRLRAQGDPSAFKVAVGLAIDLR